MYITILSQDFMQKARYQLGIVLTLGLTTFTDVEAAGGDQPG